MRQIGTSGREKCPFASSDITDRMSVTNQLHVRCNKTEMNVTRPKEQRGCLGRFPFPWRLQLKANVGLHRETCMAVVPVAESSNDANQSCSSIDLVLDLVPVTQSLISPYLYYWQSATRIAVMYYRRIISIDI